MVPSAGEGGLETCPYEVVAREQKRVALRRPAPRRGKDAGETCLPARRRRYRKRTAGGRPAGRPYGGGVGTGGWCPQRVRAGWKPAPTRWSRESRSVWRCGGLRHEGEKTPARPACRRDAGATESRPRAGRSAWGRQGSTGRSPLRRRGGNGQMVPSAGEGGLETRPYEVAAREQKPVALRQAGMSHQGEKTPARPACRRDAGATESRPRAVDRPVAPTEPRWERADGAHSG
jgi:hypothetical protein